MEENIEQRVDENVVEEKPKKSKAGKIILIVLLLILAVIGGIIFWGYRKLTAMSNPVDFGVTYTEQDYHDLQSNLGHSIEAEKLCLDCPELTFSDPRDVEVIVTNAQASAAFDIMNEALTVGKVSKTQIKFGDNMAEASTVFTYNGRDYPVYLSGNIEKATENTVSIEIFDLKVGGINLPANVKGIVQDFFIKIGNERLALMGDTFRIDDGGLTEEGLSFKGMIPTIGE